MKEGFRYTVEGGIAEVQARYDEAEYHCLACCHCEGDPNLSYVAQVMVYQSMCGSHASPCSSYHLALCQYHERTAWDAKLQYRHAQQLAVGHVWLLRW